MKTKITFVIALFLIMGKSEVIAQDIAFGPRAGLNFSTYTGDDANNFLIKPGVHVGGYISKKFTDRISFQPELLFSMKGASRKFNSSKFSQTLYYLDVPLLCGLNFSDNVRALFGVQPSIYLGGKDKLKDPSDKKTFSTPGKVRGFDIGLLAGMEYSMNNGLNFGVRIGYGFLSRSTISDYRIFNLNLQATVGYTLGKK